MFLGGASEEEEEIRGSAGGGEGRPLGDGHSSGQCAHLQCSKGSTALYLGESEVKHTLDALACIPSLGYQGQ